MQRMPMADASSISASDKSVSRKNPDKSRESKPILILYGSNAGTCQALAQRLSADAEHHDYYGEIMDMDAGTSPIQQKRLAIVIRASYEGETPDHATQFVQWITKHDKKHKPLSTRFLDVAIAIELRPSKRL